MKGTVSDMPAEFTVTDDGAKGFALDQLPAYLKSSFAHHWGRFTIYAPSMQEAARLAASLDWWLHCWSWEPSNECKIVESDVPAPWLSWAAFAEAPARRTAARD